MHVHIVLIALSLQLAACSLQLAAQNREKDVLLSSGDFPALAKTLEQRMGIQTPAQPDCADGVVYDPKRVLEHLEAAEAWRMAGSPRRALAHYDAAEQSLAAVETQGTVEKSARQAGAILTNDTLISYRPSPAESVLINYYKAITFLQLGDKQNARVELNRADDRIRRAVERYESELAEAIRETESNRTQSDAHNVDPAIQAQFPEMSQWKPYESFVVPPATYLQGLFLARSGTNGDREKARTALERVYGITSSEVVRQDLSELQRGRLCPTDDCVWILTEYGLGPELIERRFDVPAPTPQGPILVPVALPALRSRYDGIAPGYEIVGPGSARSELASTDRVLQTEFQKRFPAIVARSVASAIAKGVATYELKTEVSPLAGLLGDIAAAAVTAADTRMWRSLPAGFSVTRTSRPADGSLILRCDGQEQKILLPATGSAVVHVKHLFPGTRPSFEVAGI